MSASTIDLSSITIPNGTQESRVVNGDKEYSDAIAISLLAPAALDVATYYIMVSQNGIDFVILQSGDPAGDTSPPAVGRGRPYYDVPIFKYFKLTSSIPVTADRTWQASKQINL